MIKKKIITAAILTAVLAILAAGYFILSNWEPEAGEGDDFPQFGGGYTLFSVRADEIESIFKRTNEFEFTLVNDGEMWSVSGDDTIRLDQPETRRFAGSAAVVVSAELAEENEIYLAQWGLAEPTGILRITLRGGEVHTLQVGSRTPLQNAFYVNTLENPGRVYVVSQSAVNLLLSPLSNIRDRQISYVTQEDIAYFNISRAGSAANETTERISVIRRSEEEIAAELEELGVAGVLVPNWRITSPLNINANDTLVNDITFRLGALTINEFVDSSEITLRDAGLENPNHVIEFGGDGHNIRLHIGRREGTSSFARIYPNSQIFMLRNDDISFKDVPIRDLMSRTLHLVSIDIVDSVRVINGESEFELEIVRADGRDNNYRINGRTIERGEFTRLYQEILGIMIDGAVPETVTDVYRPVNVRIEYHYNNNRPADIIELRSLSERFFMITFNGNTEFTTEKRGVNLMLEHLRNAAR